MTPVPYTWAFPEATSVREKRSSVALLGVDPHDLNTGSRWHFVRDEDVCSRMKVDEELRIEGVLQRLA